MTGRPTWWLRYPQVWEREVQALRECDLPFEVSDRSGRGGLVRVVRVEWNRRWAGGAELVLECRFPGCYPWFPPVVVSPQLRTLGHHVSHDGVVCLLGSESDWSPVSTLADLLTTQLPRVLAAGSSDHPSAELAALEAPVPEPLSRAFPLAAGTDLLVSHAFALPAGAAGGALLRLPRGPGRWLMQAVIATTDAGSVPAPQSPAQQDPWLLGWLPESQVTTAAAGWVRLRQAPSPRRAAGHLFPRLRNRLPAPLQRRLDRELFAAILVGFPDEVGWRTVGEGLITVVRYRERAGASPLFWYAPVSRVGSGSGQGRLPDAAGVAEARAVVVGAGGLGGPTALELARSGVGELVIVDNDVVEPVNALRQLPPLTFAGVPKVLALETLIKRQAPHVRVSGVSLRVGAHGENLQRQLVHVLATADVVCDLTANPAVSRYLAAHCRAAGVALVVGAATNGGWGGTVTRLRPDVGRGCWQCLELHRRDAAFPVPPAAPEPVPDEGCTAPSFTGTAADLAAVWQHVVRVALGEIGHRRDGGYQRMPGDVHVLAQRDRLGRPVPARWTHRVLQQHTECWRHPPTVLPGVRLSLEVPA